LERNVHTADVSKRIKEIREMKRIPQEKMAELLDMTFSNYSKIENAYQNITIKHLRNVCKVLDVSADTLLFGEIDVKNGLNFDEYIELSQIFSEEELKGAADKIQKILNMKRIGF